MWLYSKYFCPARGKISQPGTPLILWLQPEEHVHVLGSKEKVKWDACPWTVTPSFNTHASTKEIPGLSEGSDLPGATFRKSGLSWLNSGSWSMACLTLCVFSGTAAHLLYFSLANHATRKRQWFPFPSEHLWLHHKHKKMLMCDSSKITRGELGRHSRWRQALLLLGKNEWVYSSPSETFPRVLWSREERVHARLTEPLGEREPEPRVSRNTSFIGDLFTIKMQSGKSCIQSQKHEKLIHTLMLWNVSGGNRHTNIPFPWVEAPGCSNMCKQ